MQLHNTIRLKVPVNSYLYVSMHYLIIMEVF